MELGIGRSDRQSYDDQAVDVLVRKSNRQQQFKQHNFLAMSLSRSKLDVQISPAALRIGTSHHTDLPTPSSSFTEPKQLLTIFINYNRFSRASEFVITSSQGVSRVLLYVSPRSRPWDFKEHRNTRSPSIFPFSKETF